MKEDQALIQKAAAQVKPKVASYLNAAGELTPNLMALHQLRGTTLGHDLGILLFISEPVAKDIQAAIKGRDGYDGLKDIQEALLPFMDQQGDNHLAAIQHLRSNALPDEEAEQYYMQRSADSVVQAVRGGKLGGMHPLPIVAQMQHVQVDNAVFLVYVLSKSQPHIEP